MDKIVSLAKRRGFIFPGSEIYGGLSGTWDYGPLGVELKNNIRREWWKMFVEGRDDMFGVESAILMHSKVWEASGHLKNFVDPMADCRACKMRFRADKIDPAKGCPNCGAKDFTEARPFNMMFKTYVGPIDPSSALAEIYFKSEWADLPNTNERPSRDSVKDRMQKAFHEANESTVYLRPETAQGMFVNFKNIVDSMHPKLPFGIAQIGKAFRNEVTPGNFIFRTREFEQMEIEYFIRPDDWETSFEYWLGEMRRWLKHIGIEKGVHEREVPAEERAHYSKRTVDIDFDFPFGKEELYGIAYRTDFDLKNHSQVSGVDLSYADDESKTKFIPHVIEPTFGVDRTLLALLVAAYKEEKDRLVLALPPRFAPVTVAVFPLLANKTALVEKARAIFESLKPHFRVAWDDRGNIGKRYYSQDEIGTPWCVTVDFQTLEDETVTVRDRDTTKQERLNTEALAGFLTERLK